MASTFWSYLLLAGLLGDQERENAGTELHRSGRQKDLAFIEVSRSPRLRLGIGPRNVADVGRLGVATRRRERGLIVDDTPLVEQADVKTPGDLLVDGIGLFVLLDRELIPKAT